MNGIVYIYIVNRRITSLDEIVAEVPEGTTKITCNNNGLLSLRGIERLPSVTTLYIRGNRFTSLEGLAGSNLTRLFIGGNHLTSLEGLAGSKVTDLDISCNHLTSLEGLAGSNVTTLNIYGNHLTSLEGLVGSNVTTLYIGGNPCSEQFENEFRREVSRVKQYYEDLWNTPKDPGFD